jgi:predicted nucleotidyltransferase
VADLSTWVTLAGAGLGARVRQAAIMSQPDFDQVAAFLRAHPRLGIVSAYLFGSHAEGRTHRESDVDLGVLLRWETYPERRARAEAQVRLGSDLIAVLHHDAVDLVILNDAPPLLGRHIVTRGQRIFVGDPELDHAFVRDVQLRAADLAPFLRRMREIKLAALAS